MELTEMPKRKQKIKPWYLREERKRRKHVVPYRKRYLICTEGKTEAIYFGHYRSSTGPIVVALDKSDHKVSLVKKTIEERNIRIQTGININIYIKNQYKNLVFVSVNLCLLYIFASKEN